MQLALFLVSVLTLALVYLLCVGSPARALGGCWWRCAMTRRACASAATTRRGSSCGCSRWRRDQRAGRGAVRAAGRHYLAGRHGHRAVDRDGDLGGGRRARLADRRGDRGRRPGWRTRRAACAATGDPRTWARSAQARSTDQALWRDSRPPRALRKRAGVPGPPAREGWAPTHQPRGERGRGIRPQGHDAPCPPSRAADTLVPLDVVDVEGHGLRRCRRRCRTAPRAGRGRAGMPGCRRPRRPRGAARRPRRDGLGQPRGGLRRAHRACWVGVEHALEGEEPVQPAHRDEGARRGGRREGRVVGVALAQAGEELGDVGSADVLRAARRPAT